MRCKNCGWDNENGQLKCEKCNAPLRGSMVDNESIDKHLGDNREESLRSTVRESSVFGSNGEDEQSRICQKCGYELAHGMKICPACGTPFGNAGETNQKINKSLECPKCGALLDSKARFCPQCGQSLKTGTIGAWDNPQHDEFCTLRPIAWTKEEIAYNPITYSGQTIVLRRNNTDPNNQTITSKEQAILTHENGSWYIEDCSEMKTTMIRVSKKTKLESGDIIALGNRLFEFKG